MAKLQDALFPNLKLELFKQNMTQEDLGNVLGMDKSAVSRRMRGEVDWELSEIRKVCEYLKLDAHYLFSINN